MATVPSSGTAGTSVIAALGRTLTSPYLLLVCATLFWAGNAVVGRAFGGSIPPISLSFWRWTIGCLLLLPFTGRDIARAWPAILRHWRLLLLYVALGVIGCNVLTYKALHYTTAVNSSLINSATPIFVVCLSFLLYRDGIKFGQALGVGVSLLGVVIIVLGGQPARLGELAVNRGDLMMVVSIGMWSAYTVLLRRKPESIPPMAFLTVLMGIGALILLPLQLVERQVVGALEPSLPNLLAIFYIALFPAVLALYFWNRAVAQLGANRASPFVHLMPIFGTLMAMVFLGEQFNPHQAAGIAAILFGVYLASSRRRVRPADA